MSADSLKVALPKGRLFQEVVERCQDTDLLAGEENLSRLSRKLVQVFPQTGHLFLLAKPVDVPAYVEHGAADIGFTGKDIIAEKERELYEVLDLGLGACQLVVAVPDDFPVSEPAEMPDNIRVATSYPGLTARYFQKLGIKAEIIELGGSVELAPQVDLSDIIVDITSTGTTLKENGLKPVAEVLSSSVRLVVNRISYKTKSESITRIVNQLADREKSKKGCSACAE